MPARARMRRDETPAARGRRRCRESTARRSPCARPASRNTSVLGLRLAQRRDRRIVGERVEVAVRRVDVDLLELRRRGQQDVGVVGGVGLEDLVHDAEEVLACEARRDLAPTPARRRPDSSCRRRSRESADRFASSSASPIARHVDRSRRAADEVGALERRDIDRIGARRRQQRAAGRIAPRADQRRQAGDGAHGVAAAGMALHAVVDADRRRPGRAVVARQRDHRLGRQCRRCCATRSGGYSAARVAQRVEADRVAIDVVVIDEVLGDQHVHQAERERGVGARQERDVLVALFGRLAAIRVDGDELRAAALRFLRARPQVQVGRDRVAAPDEDQAAVLELLDVGPDDGADRRDPAGLAGGRADGAVEQRRAEAMEEAAVHRAVLQEAHRARVVYGTMACGPSVEAAIAPKRVGDRRRAPRPTRCARSGLRPCCPRAASDAARARPNTCVRGSARPSCTACRRSAGGRARRGFRSPCRPRRSTSIAHVSGQSCGQAPRTTVRAGTGRGACDGVGSKARISTSRVIADQRFRYPPRHGIARTSRCRR